MTSHIRVKSGTYQTNLFSNVSLSLYVMRNCFLSVTFSLNLRPYTSATAGRDLRAATRFRPNAQTLQQFSTGLGFTELTSIAPVQEVMCNVYSFVLAFAAFSISDAQMTIVGRGLHSSTFRLDLGAFYGTGVHVGVV